MIPIHSESNPFFREDAAGFKHNERNKQSVSQKKLTKRIIRLTAQAITDFSMIEEGDKVMVAMSGGKDSYVLLDALRTLQKRAPISFELLAVTVNPHIPQFPAETLRAYFEAEKIPYHIEDQDIYSIIQKLIPEGKSVCSLCARLRRGVLYRLAGELGCTKIALGHHMDDIVGTLLLNLFYGGRLKAMPPVLRSDDGKPARLRSGVRDGKIRQAAGLPSCPQRPLRRRRKSEATGNQGIDAQLGPRIPRAHLQPLHESATGVALAPHGQVALRLPQLRFARSPRGGSGGSARMRARAETEKSYLATMLSIHLTFKRVIWNYENPLHESHRHGRPQGRDHHR